MAVFITGLPAKFASSASSASRNNAAMPGAPQLHLVDSVGHVTPAMRGGVIVSGSHGGLSAAYFVEPLVPHLSVFNDAGIGREGAGIAGLEWLQAKGLAACAVLHASARIGDAASTLDDGVVGHANEAAAALGVRVGMPCRDAVAQARAARLPAVAAHPSPLP